MFIDEASIQVRAGKGGNGCVSFRREKFVPRGGPDGGDGGDGGSVVLVVDANLRTLLSFRHHARFVGGNGVHGKGKQMSGRRGSECIIRVPAGTVVQEWPSLRPVADLIAPGETITVARGGRGGKGNVHFKSSRNRAPRMSTPGGEGEERGLRLTLKLLADVGLVGLPNVGKSTLLRRLSNATPKVGDFPFTTLQPSLGIVALGDYDSFVLADLPGLVEGAHEGRGLGIRFLRHIERTRLLLVLIDSASTSPERDLATLLGELGSFSPALLQRPRIICYSRSDLAPMTGLPALDEETPPAISAQTGAGLSQLLRLIAGKLGEIRTAEGVLIPDLLEGPHVPSAGPEGSVESVGGDSGGGDFGGVDTAGNEMEADPEALTLFADRVDRGGELGRTPWPRRYLSEVSGSSPDPEALAASRHGGE